VLGIKITSTNTTQRVHEAGAPGWVGVAGEKVPAAAGEKVPADGSGADPLGGKGSGRVGTVSKSKE
jgi:hypothetical protein